jgi:oligopeptidase B
LGRAWYEGGRLMNKRNGIVDFLDCCSDLFRRKITHPSTLVAMGTSAGGLLVGTSLFCSIYLFIFLIIIIFFFFFFFPF